MANEFSKEERVAFEQILEGFEDQLVMSRNVSVYQTNQEMMERTGNVIWRPQPYIMESQDGADATADFKEVTQLSVPAQISFDKHVAWMLDALELRDALQEGRIVDAAKQRLASDINIASLNAAALLGSLVIKRTVAATGHVDVAQCDTIMNSQGVPAFDRYLALSSADYNGMADNLATRAMNGEKMSRAYEESYVGKVAGFRTFKLDYARRLAAAAGGAGVTISTLAGGGNVYVPVASRVASTGERSNVDNRFQTVLVNTTANVAAGDAFTIATVNAVHHVTKQDTGALKTFRVVSIVDGTHMVITPPIVSAQGGTDAELQYQNCVVGTPAGNSAIVFLNTAAAPANPFWQKDAIEILPGRLSIPGDGVAVMRATTEQGFEVVMQKQWDVALRKNRIRVDTIFGVCNKQPEMSGIILFNQT